MLVSILFNQISFPSHYALGWSQNRD